jgi:hypothetical protein
VVPTGDLQSDKKHEREQEVERVWPEQAIVRVWRDCIIATLFSPFRFVMESSFA